MPTMYVAPQAGSGGVNLRSRAQVDPSTMLGTLNEGAKLELEKQSGEWNTAKVYVATQVAGAAGNLVKSLPGWGTINIRSAPSTDPGTDVGDLNSGQSLELISGPANGWFVARVYLSAQYSIVVSDQPAPPPPPGSPEVPNGSDELKRLRQALDRTRDDLVRVKDGVKDKLDRDSSFIYEALLLILDDPTLVGGLGAIIREDKARAEWALSKANSRYEQLFESLADE